MTFPFVYLVLHSFAAWDQVDRKIIPTTFSLRSWTWLFGGSATSADVPWIGAFVNTTIVATIATFFNDGLCIDGRVCACQNRI